MNLTIGKILALIIVAAWCAVMIAGAGGVTPDIVKGALALLLPLALIIFPEQLGNFTGYVGRGGNIDTPSPAILISFLGWFILLGVPLLVHFLS